MKQYALAALLLAVLFVAFGSSLFIGKRRAADERTRLREENAILKSQLHEVPRACAVPALASATVLSTYPLNAKSAITLNLGSVEGVKNGAAVTLGTRILVGRITGVFAHTSVAKTVYDPEWQLPVRIGMREIDGLLVGGADPKVTLIPKSKPIAAGDVVYSASSDVPYGLEIGVIRSISQDAGGAFQYAQMDVAFSVNDLRIVGISDR